MRESTFKIGLAFALIGLLCAPLAAEFTQTTSLPDTAIGHALVHADGRLYHLGGLGSQVFDSADKVYYSKITSPGVLGEWVEGESLPKAMFFHAGAAWNKTLYAIGGQHVDLLNPRNRIPRAASTVYYSALNADGSPGPWKTTTPMPEALIFHAAAVSNGILYVSGGWLNGTLSNRVYSAPIQADGSLGQWTPLASLPESLHSHAAVQDGTLYLLGGIDANADIQSTVYMSRIQNDGTLETWSETTPMTRPLGQHAASIVHGRIFVTGGTTGAAPTDEVLFAPILSDRSLGSWEVAPSLPAPLYQHSSVAADGALYVSGGANNTGWQSAVYSLVLEQEESAPVATAALHPNTLNLVSKGKFVTLYLEFPTFASQASQIDPASVRIVAVNGGAASLPALAKPTGVGDGNENGIEDLMVKFDRASLAALMGGGDNRIEFAGELKDGTAFTSEDTIWAKAPKKTPAQKRALTMPTLSYSTQSVRGIVGKRGGTVKSASRAGVNIPEGATGGVDITVMPEDTQDEVKNLRRLVAKLRKTLKEAGPAVEYGPEGTQFDKPVTLELPYDPSLLPAGEDEDSLQVHYWNPQTKEWEALVSTVDRNARVVRAQTTHFSLYQVLSGGAPAASGDADSNFHFREIYAYPNPARRGEKPTLHIEAEEADRVDIRIYDLSGERVHAATVEGPAPMIDDGSGRGAVRAFEYVWDVSGTASGVYIYVVTAHKAGRGTIRASGKVAVIK